MVADPTHRFENHEDYCTVELLSNLADAQWAAIDATADGILERLADRKPPKLLIDLSHLKYMGSSIVALLVRVWKSVQDAQGRMVVLVTHPVVREVIELAGLAKKWTVVDTRDDGLDELEVRSAPHALDDEKGNATTLLALTALLGAAVGLFILLVPLGIIHDLRIKIGILFGFAILGLVVGTAVTMGHAGAKRGIGIFVVVACLAIVVVGILHLPDGKDGRKGQHDGVEKTFRFAAYRSQRDHS